MYEAESKNGFSGAAWREAAQMLSEMGIKGIQYHREGDKEGSHIGAYQYTIFDDKEIVKHNALFSLSRPSLDSDPIGYLKHNAEQLAGDFAADKAEVIRQIEAVEKLYPPETNKYHAPNGKASKLNHAQWYTARTPFFKKWFGDWEAGAELNISDTNVSIDKTVETLKSLANTDLHNLETGITARINSEQRNKITSKVALDKSILNGFTAGQHNAAAARINALFRHASLIETSKDKGGDVNIASIKRFASPVIFGNETAIAYLTIKESVEQGHRIYSLELLEIKKSRPKGGTPNSDTTGRITDERITQLLNKVNPSKVSKVVDENGEPLVLWHSGTFDKNDIPNEGIHFGTQKAEEDRRKSQQWKHKTPFNSTLAFLNFKNPKKIRDGGTTWDVKIAEAKKEGHDGLVYENFGEDIGSTSWVAFTPEQIKSATDNAGTYSNENKSILFQLNQAPDTGTSDGASADNKSVKSAMQENFKVLAGILETGETKVVNNPVLGDISVDKGHTGKHGYGLDHIIEQRVTKDKVNIDEAAALLYLVVDAAKDGIVSREISRVINGQKVGSYDIEKSGIIAFVSKNKRNYKRKIYNNRLCEQ